MEYVTLIAMLALVQYLFFGMMVGRARGMAGIQAPQVTGDPEFERVFRAHYNTLEQLVVFVPALFAGGYYGSELAAVAAGVVYLVGRTLYFRAYVRDPGARGPGMLLTFAANAVLVVMALVGALVRAF
jgi:glutathione S-transferase